MAKAPKNTIINLTPGTTIIEQTPADAPESAEVYISDVTRAEIEMGKTNLARVQALLATAEAADAEEELAPEKPEA
jgi:predicted nucleic acid-binding protein